MPLAPGSKLGHYALAELIGKGGMGEVYKALDTKLNRHVALKVLPGALANNPERMARFQREAQLLASLNHPNIAAIYGLEDSGSHSAIVMELVEGDTLKGPLPISEALRLAKQIADAVEYAHDKTVIHRDLKPANIKVTPEGQVKVLDFGLAKALDDAGSSRVEGDPMDSMSPTLTMGGTQAGVILGTAAYMAPEQAKGKRADRKADVWSFGVVLYEMLTGKRVFGGETMAETLASVMMAQLSFADLPNETPAPLRKLVTRCLDRDLKRRVQSMGEVRIALEDILSGAATEEVKVVVQPTPTNTALIPWAVAALATVAAIAGIWAPWRTPEPSRVVRFEVPPPPKNSFDNGLQLSPDGKYLMFTTPTVGPDKGIFVRALDTLESRKVALWSQNPVPFWSADSRFIAYQQDGKLKKVDIAGGPPIPLSDAPASFGGGAWNAENVIVFGDRGGPLKQVSSAGGVPVLLTKLDAKREELAHVLPSFLPDQKHFLYFARSSKPELTGVYIGEIGVAPDKQESKLLMATSAAAVYTSSPDLREATKGLGFLLFLREATLMAQPFDAEARELRGEPVPIADQIAVTSYAFGRFSASANGSLVYATGGDGATSQLTWFDRNGKNLGTIGQPARYGALRISPDGTRVAVDKFDVAGSDLWLIDSVPGGKNDRFTFTPQRETAPQWSPDGSQIVYATLGSVFALFKKPTNLSGKEGEIFKTSEQKVLMDWSRDGKSLLFGVYGGSAIDLWTLDLADNKPTPFANTPAREIAGRFSPDGRWVAFHAVPADRSEVYVRPFPANESGGQQMVSVGGGSFPMWRRDGRELYYRNAGVLYAVDVTPGPAPKFGQPRQLFQFGPTADPGSPAYNSDVTADGSRFLFNLYSGATDGATPLTVVLNWTAGLK